MLKEGLDVFLPMVDDDAIDDIIKKSDGSFVEVQIKARSEDNKFGNAALFAGIKHEYRPNYWFIFYSERMDKLWILSSKEFIEETSKNKNGKNIGKRSLKLNGTKGKIEYLSLKFKNYLVNDFKRIQNENPDAGQL
jgi:hypothetical protein